MLKTRKQERSSLTYDPFLHLSLGVLKQAGSDNDIDYLQQSTMFLEYVLFHFPEYAVNGLPRVRCRVSKEKQEFV